MTFHGNDYAAHLTCISEAEKYEKTLFKGKKEKLNPQDAWNAIVETAIANSANASADIRNIIYRLGY